MAYFNIYVHMPIHTPVASIPKKQCMYCLLNKN